MGSEALWKWIEQIEGGLAGLKKELQVTEPPSIRWARQMLSVLAEVGDRGGVVTPEEFLQIGEAFGYERQGMAGFYQRLVTLVDGMTKLTPEGEERLKALQASYEKLSPKVA